VKKRVLAVAFALAISIVAAGVSFGQPRVLVVNIPFAFEVGNRILPAGQYRIDSMPTGSGTVRRIRQVNGDAQVILSSIAVAQKEATFTQELIFRRYGKIYFLAQIWNGDGKGEQISTSPQEEMAAHSVSGTEIALAVQ
jgi:hypothetical protein